MKHITVRNVPEDLERALTEEKQRRGKSLNQTVIDLLKQALGVGPDGKRSNSLGRLAGGWSEDEFRAFESAVAETERIDPELWR